MARQWLLLHGVPLSPQVWDPIRPRLCGEVAVPDLNATIESVPQGGVLQSRIAVKLLADLPAGELIVVGHSFGGQVALELAFLAPQRVGHLIIVCSRHTPFPAFTTGARRVAAGEPVDIGAGLARWFRPAELAADGPAVRYARHQISHASRRPWAAALAAVADYDRSADVGSLGMPVRLIAAGHDHVSPPAAMADLAAAVPDARLEIIDDWAHMSPFATPELFAARLGAAGC